MNLEMSLYGSLAPLSQLEVRPEKQLHDHAKLQGGEGVSRTNFEQFSHFLVKLGSLGQKRSSGSTRHTSGKFAGPLANRNHCGLGELLNPSPNAGRCGPGPANRAAAGSGCVFAPPLANRTA